ncbi:hypothetical protein OUZ56_020564 [Daphnia magna]|uniref:Uncharacterized protein n=1 Tax=Daphnia magna TaxID=35525 RepID=A0ABQ9ZET6_9CRUS|nr:hypothetical protein OUZ56_020564 [Daphnia magna]
MNSPSTTLILVRSGKMTSFRNHLLFYHPVVFKPVKIQSTSSPVATVTNAIAYKFGFHSQIPVRNHGKPFKKESPADPLPDLACHLVPNCRPEASLNDFPLIPCNRIDIKSADEGLLVQSQEIVWDPEEEEELKQFEMIESSIRNEYVPVLVTSLKNNSIAIVSRSPSFRRNS